MVLKSFNLFILAITLRFTIKVLYCIDNKKYYLVSTVHIYETGLMHNF